MHQLEVNGSGETFAAIRRRGIEISGAMRSWLHWLGHTAIGLAGAFIVASTFIWPHATPELSPRWLAFGVAAVAGTVGLGLLLDGLVDVQRTNMTLARTTEILLTTASVAVAAALMVLTAAHGIGNLRWWTFGLGAGLVGASLIASIVHELSTERVRHELEVAQTTVGELVIAAGCQRSGEGRMTAPLSASYTVPDLNVLVILNDSAQTRSPPIHRPWLIHAAGANGGRRHLSQQPSAGRRHCRT